MSGRILPQVTGIIHGTFSPSRSTNSADRRK